MAIPYWREVKYTDDGCSEFQCLNCYNSWEARTSPGRQTYECGNCEYCTTKVWSSGAWSCHGDAKYRRYVPFFLYCPFCATKWVGEMLRPETHRKAIVQKILDEMPYPHIQRKREWVIECKTPSSSWYRHYSYDLHRFTAKQVLENLKRFRKEEEHEVLKWSDDPLMTEYAKRAHKEFRVVIG